jgi:hypothetical protein
MVAENMAALFVFVLWVAAFALGYALRGLYAGTFEEWAHAFTYRDRSARTRARSRRASNGEH